MKTIQVIQIVVSVILGSLLSSSPVGATPVYTYIKQMHPIGSPIIHNGKQSTVCVRINRGNEVSWFLADIYKSNERNIKGEAVISAFIGTENEREASFFHSSCKDGELANIESKNNSPILTGVYNIIIPSNDGKITVIRGIIDNYENWIETDLN